MEHAAIVTPGRRIAAWSLDFGVVVLLTVALGWVTQYRIGDYLSDWPSLGASSAWELMGSEGDVTAAGVEIGSGVVGELMSLVKQGFLALIVLTALVRFGTLAWIGHSAGGALAEVGVVAHGSDPRLSRGRAARHAISTTVKDVGLYAAACIALVHGAFGLSVALWMLAVAALIADAIPALRPGGRSLCDRLSGTAPARARLYRRALEQSARLRRAGIDGTQQAIAAGRRIATSERAERAKDAGRRLASSERAEQVLDAGRRLASAESAEQARDAVRRLADSERAQQATATSRRIAADISRRVGSSDHVEQAAATGKRLATDLASSERARQAKAAGQRLGNRLRGARS